MVRQGVVRQVRCGKAWLGKAGLGEARSGVAGEVRFDEAGCGEVR